MTAALLVPALAAPATGATQRPFADGSFWNSRLRSGAPVRADSGYLVDELVRQVREHGVWINTTRYSVPVYTVGAGQPAASIRVESHSAHAPTLQAGMNAVPVPDNARPAVGTDRHMVVWQPARDTMWEFFGSHRPPLDPCPWGNVFDLRWHTLWGARITRVSRSSGINPAPFGATATGLPLIGGLMRINELRAGRLDHVLALAIPEAKRAEFVWPATRTDGRSDREHAIPQGTRFRLDPTLDVSRLNLPPVGAAIARAAQKYGMVVRDGATGVGFYAEDPTPTGADPYPTLFGGMSPKQVLERFPWERLRALTPR